MLHLVGMKKKIYSPEAVKIVLLSSRAGPGRPQVGPKLGQGINISTLALLGKGQANPRPTGPGPALEQCTVYI